MTEPVIDPNGVDPPGVAWVGPLAVDVRVAVLKQFFYWEGYWNMVQMPLQETFPEEGLCIRKTVHMSKLCNWSLEIAVSPCIWADLTRLFQAKFEGTVAAITRFEQGRLFVYLMFELLQSQGMCESEEGNGPFD